MPDIPTLYAAEPLSIAATYDKLWVREIVVSAPEIGGDAEARVTLELFRSTADGAERAPAEPLRLAVGGLLSGADSDPDLAAAVQSLMRYVAKAAMAQGLVANQGAE
jgi:hypothetical protein